MIVSFYDENFKGLQNNASLVVGKDSFKLVKRPVDIDSLNCVCEAYTEDIQPTFVIIKDDNGSSNYIYSGFAGVPVKNSDNQTEITGTDLKSYFSSDVWLTVGEFSTVNEYLNYLFNQFNQQVNKRFTIELVFKEYIEDIAITDLKPISEAGSYNIWEQIQPILKFYDLYIEGRVDIVNKKIIYTIGRTMLRNMNVKLWEYGVENVGKWLAPVNEAQGYSNGVGSQKKWILLKNGKITITENLRDIYPVKKVIVINDDSMEDADKEAIEQLLGGVYQEDIVLPIEADFETKFSVYVKQGAGLYKELPCGELVYDSTGLIKVQLGYRYIGAEFI